MAHNFCEVYNYYKDYICEKYFYEEIEIII